MGDGVAYWRGQPHAYLLWTYHHLQELDRRRGWLARMQRVETAMLGAMGFHDPKLLDTERNKTIAEAAGGLDMTEARAGYAALAERLPELLSDGDANGEG